MSEENSEQHAYRLEVISDSQFCKDQNLYICIASYEGKSEKPASVVYVNACPLQQGETASVQTEIRVERITIAIYMVPQEYPESRVVAENPPFPVIYKVYKDGGLIDEKSLYVDRWGGIQVIGIPYK